ncbi:MAG: lysylphosphatidylglycerol synthase transmembrane domain-containing protein [Bacteroidota bacterium]
MLKKSLSVIQYIFFLGLGIGLLWYSFRHMTDEQIEQLKESFRQTKYIYLVPVVITLMLSHFSRSMRWRILMEPLGYKPTRMNVFLSVMIGYFFNLLVPRLGEVMKCTTLAKYEKVPPDKLIGTIVAERTLDLICLLLVIILTIAVQFDVVGHHALDLFSGLVKNEDGGFSLIKLGIYLTVLAFIVFGLKWLFKRFGSSGFFLKVKMFFRGIWEGITSFKRVQQKGWLLFHTIFIWSMYLVSIYIGFYAFPQITHLGIKGSLSVLTFGSLGMIIPTPGGMGSYQYILQKTLPLYDVSEVTSFAFGNVLWGAQTIILVVFGVFSLVMLPIYNRVKKPKSP